MTDRELLELAAQAEGHAYPWVLPNGFGERPWNPLTDDGDALRLAARLRLTIRPGKHPGDGCTVESQRAGVTGCTVFRDDPAEQMRRAIVMVAAEIGRLVR